MARTSEQMMARPTFHFVVVATMTKQRGGSLDIKTCMFFITANNEHEAYGQGLAQAMDQLPGYQLATIMCSLPPESWMEGKPNGES